ncbi:hypothetical protein PFICI_07892 [Pestalotiopsis fici W106-1]|uniref:Ecp2 effector protein domain-containing protein n=1 Tax=Pestalotiopsis fici (strain W106-1 / CGMCC3.15140) TaxID=1229662 RepID=W3X2J4_PESFW|nr:uncharacterized protein PFICI_07892 [Pestalotiopsis fici W106-1]ETS80363.1 hypothetical protein PFICI_07892 [Pestalotiopsis fici W106-1]
MRNTIIIAATLLAAAIQSTHGTDTKTHEDDLMVAAAASTIHDGSRIGQIVDGQFILNTTFLSLQPEDCQNAWNWMPITFPHCSYVRRNATTTEAKKGGEEDEEEDKIYLDWTLLLPGTGQRRQQWCEAIIHHTLQECGLADADLTERRCIRDDRRTLVAGYDPERGEAGEDVLLYGVHVGFRMALRRSTVAPSGSSNGNGNGNGNGDNNVECVARAIRAATCRTVNVAELECFELDQELIGTVW